jgi:hypothetical protein
MNAIALQAIAFGIDDPTVQDSERSVPTELHAAIDVARGRRQDLDDQQRRLFDAASRGVVGLRHEEVGLEDVVRR